MFGFHFLKQSGAARPLLIRALSLAALFVALFAAQTFALRGIRWPETFANSKAEGQTHTILIKDFKYAPESLTIKLGDTIIWKNEDIVPHTVTADGKRFDSKNIAAKASWKYAPNKPGTYPYICAYHPTMKAKLIVQ
ncbi:MAG: cupredoxin family copper-binding protein [Acidobacteriota bacterium]|nr:cupredoxin family copper-binding protein [Acidobacteriota bacterium]